jgi:flavin reductase (DIM6/NTAB) family NADH-FMN oxidoreductase RutF
MEFKKIKASEWNGNVFEAIGKQWFLLTAGTPEKFNTMTASWGMAGIMWNMPSVTCYVRQSRYTFGFMEEGDIFTLSFFGEEQRKALAFCGSHSGREFDKVKETGLTPAVLNGAPAFAEAQTVFVCRKRYASDIKPEDLPAEIRSQFYGSDAAHRLYIGEITAIYIKD